jgi:hypothetical protein
MYSGQHRDRFLGDVDATENRSRLRNAREPLSKHFSRKMTELQEDMVLFRTYTTTFADFDGHTTRYDVARGKILRCRSISLHEPFTFRVQQITSLPTRA